MTTKFLTPKQKQVLDYVLEFQRACGYAPSQQEIANHFGFSSLGTVQHYLKELGGLGYLQKEPNARRGLSASAQGTRELGQTSVLLPLLGRVAAGRPIEALISQEFVEVPRSLLRKSGEHFVLEVRGDSMIGDGILEGDQVIIRKQTRAENGETVVALLGGSEATIKRYYQRHGQVELHSANPAYVPIQVDGSREFRIEGVLSGLIRRIDQATTRQTSKMSSAIDRKLLASQTGKTTPRKKRS